jgi:hypothetical protein
MFGNYNTSLLLAYPVAASYCLNRFIIGKLEYYRREIANQPSTSFSDENYCLYCKALILVVDSF